ncbi:EAL domain-containing protein [Paenibacillus sp. GCM10023252]|uniref:bifunctional diguanylate cyclase/phosphodiesterase n=1 Tax=Paenibacillus sp. GCM10023252 TaxID=3252649 RepID=UPI0036228ADE
MNMTLDTLSSGEAYAQLETALQLARAVGRRIAAVYIHIDSHPSLPLETLEEKILQGLSPSIPVFRTGAGGSTFFLYVEAGEKLDTCIAELERRRQAAEAAFLLEGNGECGLWIGASVFPQDGHTSVALMERAGTALAQARERSDSRICFYSGNEVAEKAYRQAVIQSTMRQALYSGQLDISYQPIFRTGSGRLKGYEALIRWIHPQLGVVWPRELIPVAERTGLIVPIGEWLIRQACMKLAAIHKYSKSELTISVNLSPVQLRDPSFAPTVLRLLDEAGIPAGCLELEISEHDSLGSDSEAILVLKRLSEAGVRLVLDHYHQGGSCGADLKNLPLSGLKLNKSFMKGLAVSEVEQIMVQTMLELAHKLGLEVTATGVECEEQYLLLREWGCDSLQGFLLGKPMEPDQLDLSMIKR